MSFFKLLHKSILLSFAFNLLLSVNIPLVVHAESVAISVRETQLRSKKDFLSQGSKLTFGERLSVLSQGETWLKVRTIGGKEGFVHRSAISDRTLTLRSDKKTALSDDYSSKDEVVLASKGFDKEVEQQFAKNNRSLNFSAVNQMEKISVSSNEVSAFIKTGMLLSTQNQE